MDMNVWLRESHICFLLPVLGNVNRMGNKFCVKNAFGREWKCFQKLDYIPESKM